MREKGGDGMWVLVVRGGTDVEKHVPVVMVAITVVMTLVVMVVVTVGGMSVLAGACGKANDGGDRTDPRGDPLMVVVVIAESNQKGYLPQCSPRQERGRS